MASAGLASLVAAINRPLLLIALLPLLSLPATAAIITVGPGGPPTYDHSTIQAAINAANVTGDTIQVAAGTYRENLVWSTKSIQLVGAGPALSIINGDLDADGTGDGSCLRMSLVPDTARIEGFTFCGGRSTASSGHIVPMAVGPDDGGGIFCSDSSPLITGNVISRNRANRVGAGICTSAGSPTIRGNVISGNTAASAGGGIYCDSDSAVIAGNIISDNSAPVAGGLWLGEGSPVVTGNTIARNSASFFGGGIASGAINPIITNTIVALNTGGGGIVVSSGTLTVSHCDVYGNTGGNYTGIADQTGSAGNISNDPLFANAAGGDFHLKSKGGRWNGSTWVIDAAHSPCIDTGDPASPYANETAPNGDRVNMGAYGNTAEASRNFTDLKPTVTVTAPADGSTIATASVVVQGTASDDHGLDRVIVRINGGTWFDAMGTTAWSAWVAVQSGANLIEARARDNGLQWGPIAQITVNATSDLKPTVQISAPEDGVTISADQVQVFGTAYDDGALAQVRVRVNGGLWLAAVGTANWSALVTLQGGANLIEARAQDTAGLWGPIVSLTVNRVADLKPTAQITSPADGAYIAAHQIEVLGSAQDDGAVAKVRVRVNGGLWFDATGTDSWSAWVTLQSGANLIEARALDNAGQWGPIASITVTGAADLKPVALFTTPAEGATVDAVQVLAGGIASDDHAVSKVIVRVNGGAWFDALGMTSWSAMVNVIAGPMLLEARARDDAGQWGPIAARTVTGVSGDLKPIVRISSPTDGATVSASPIQVTGTAVDDGALSKVVVRVNGGTWTVASGRASWGASVNLVAGANLIEARAQDTAGQWGPIAGVAVTLSGSGSAQVAGLVAQPSAVGGEIVFSLTTGGAVTAEVLNIAGRPIRTIVTDREMPAGLSTLHWDGRSNQGLSVPNGTYLIRLTTHSPDGARARALTTLQVVR